MSNKSLSERKKQFLEDCCGGGGPTMSMGDGGYQSDAPVGGPAAGYDPMLGNKKERKLKDTIKRLKKK